MKQAKFFLLFLILLLSVYSSSLFAQHAFVVSEKSSNCFGKESFFNGQLANDDKYQIKFADAKLYDKEELHIFCGDTIISIFSDWHLNLEDFYDSSPGSSIMEEFKIHSNIILSGYIVVTELKTFLAKKGKITDGCISIEYNFDPKSVVIYFDGLKVEWCNANEY